MIYASLYKKIFHMKLNIILFKQKIYFIIYFLRTITVENKELAMNAFNFLLHNYKFTLLNVIRCLDISIKIQDIFAL